jgi:hypothetical protein
MSAASILRSAVPLVCGLGLGALGATLFEQSLPGAAGSPEERAQKLELELKRAQSRITALEGGDPRRRERPGKTFGDQARTLAQDLRDGRPVTPDDVFRASQPLLRDLVPLLDRMRVRDQNRAVEELTGELTRKHGLTPQQRESLRAWFEAKSEENARRWTALVEQEGTRMEDLMKASRDVRPDDGLDEFMQRTLSGGKLEDFNRERRAERVERVQQEADRKVAQLDGIVALDESQRGEVYNIMARSSRDYDPALALEGVSGGKVTNRQEAVLRVMKPDQRDAYQAAQAARRDEAAKSIEAMGLTLPADGNGDDLLD